MNHRNWYTKGIRDGIPIALGYFAVAFALGIAAKRAGLTPWEAGFTAALTNASAGGYAGFTLMAAGAAYMEMAVTQLIINARYLLMSCALSQKLDPKTPLWKRMLMAFGITDEIFGISVSIPGTLDPYYNYGAMTVAIPGWAGGTFLGVLMGSILPARVISALGVGLYGMFLAIIIPPARKNKLLAGLVLLSMGLSLAFSRLPLLSGLTDGVRIILLTVVISLGAAVLFPVKEEENG